jgi:hypothetical protein
LVWTFYWRWKSLYTPSNETENCPDQRLASIPTKFSHPPFWRRSTKEWVFVYHSEK